jgi:hypothetical protein
MSAHQSAERKGDPEEAVDCDPSLEPLRAQLVETFGPASFPVRRPTDLLPPMASGRDVFVVDGVELVALEIALTAGESLSFPYETADALAEDVVSALRRSRPE